ncbi:MAG: DUF4198 domain-containing protein [Pseudomonadota bacterium]
MIKKTLLLAMLAGLSLNALAARSWLLPSATVVEGRDPWVTVDAANSENLFDFDTVALDLAALVVTGPDGAAVTPENRFMGKLRNGFDLKLVKPGTYKASLVSEITMANYKLNGEPKRWRGNAAAMAAEVPANAEELQVVNTHNRVETYVTAGRSGGTPFKLSGVGIEMEPLTHPNELRAGEQARWRFLIDGKPAAKFGFSLVPGGVRHRGLLGELRFTTDAKGEATVTLPAAGMYWLNAGFPGASAQAAPAASRKLLYAATLEIQSQ